MEIKIRGARENNLKGCSVDIGEGLTVVTGISGSGKTSLVFDSLYRESRRRLLEVFNAGRYATRLTPAKVDSIIGIGPSIAVGQNLLNRNPFSTLATAQTTRIDHLAPVEYSGSWGATWTIGKKAQSNEQYRFYVKAFHPQP
ncbi:MAG: hypothetical protein JSW05_12525 [Candidatus Thorarchaeota archaeon]|nr:MAG: hypothetical protein JSW05_12525 [Candidatus Thorarchaeota archaeon]